MGNRWGEIALLKIIIGRRRVRAGFLDSCVYHPFTLGLTQGETQCETLVK